MQDITPVRVIRNDRGGILLVDTPSGPMRARLPARFRRMDDPTQRPTVGDWVILGDGSIDGDPAVEDVLGRRTAIIRQAPSDRGADAQVLAANVDVMLIVVALDEPLNTRRLDRYLTLAWDSGTAPVVVLTKADRCDDVDAAVAEVKAATLGGDVIALSGLTGEGVDGLGAYLAPGQTGVLLGMSGAGKSTLANRLLGQELLATREVRSDGRGRHTTTHRELLTLPSGALLIDTPGLRELGLWEAEDGLASTFSDVEELAAACRFTNCQHHSEPACAVLAAVDDGTLTTARLASYRKLQAELAHLARKQDVRLRQAEHRKWKQVHKAMRVYQKERGH